MKKSIDDALHYRRAVRKYQNKDLPAEIVQICIERATLSPSSSNMQLWEFHHVTSFKYKEDLSHYCLDQSAAKTAQEFVVIVVRKDLWKKRAKANIEFLKASFGEKKESEYSKREKFALNYYRKIVPISYTDFLGILGYLKFAMMWVIGLFRPIYRNTRNSDSRIVVHKSAALAAQTFMLSMASEGLDTCPMEGIDTKRIKRLLNLSFGAEINMVISCGYRADNGVYGPRFRIPFEEVYKKW
jgi:nitroreductase